ncbi:hypothetical protein L1987_06631 [Smallanthus sonchifolius]|uniref:Uncharacterized protein n=1 Tax=Smallanthus sonchifolius TaxID=185202 RepID=A0ACB9JYX5_9ASTR|nr:hypothetical protein L1987_06631 [Smallanthus sonchifolius]
MVFANGIRTNGFASQFREKASANGIRTNGFASQFQEKASANGIRTNGFASKIRAKAFANVHENSSGSYCPSQRSLLIRIPNRNSITRIMIEITITIRVEPKDISNRTTVIRKSRRNLRICLTIRYHTYTKFTIGTSEVLCTNFCDGMEIYSDSLTPDTYRVLREPDLRLVDNLTSFCACIFLGITWLAESLISACRRRHVHISYFQPHIVKELESIYC